MTGGCILVGLMVLTLLKQLQRGILQAWLEALIWENPSQPRGHQPQQCP